MLDLAHAFETFATRGLRVEGTLGAPNGGPVGITRVDTGKRVIKNRTERKRVISTGVADNTTAIMRNAVSIGTGKRAQYGGYAAGKTGTTENNVDAWFVGFSKELTVAVWVGYPDSGKPMQTEYNGEPVEGGTYPAAIWGQFQRSVAAILDRRSTSGDHKAPTGPDVPLGGDDGGDGPTGPGESGDVGKGVPVAGSGSSAGPSSGSSGTGATSTAGGTGTSSSGSGSATGGGGTGGPGGGAGSGTSTPTTPPAATPTPAPSTGSGSGSGPGAAPAVARGPARAAVPRAEPGLAPGPAAPRRVAAAAAPPAAPSRSSSSALARSLRARRPSGSVCATKSP